MSDEAHWDAAYEGKGAGSVSWFEPVPEASLSMIEGAGPEPTDAIVDVGGGASRLAAELVRRGYRDVTVADLAAAALRAAQEEHAAEAERIAWVEADVRVHDFGREFDLWHDRAVFHFMVEEDDRAAYLANLRRSLRVGGHLVLATFGARGPTSCSGLPVRRYDAAAMADLLDGGFELVTEELVAHRTPSGNEQQFQYGLFARIG